MDDQGTNRAGGGIRYRKLRIAWSVACGILCLLLIALWVRSYVWRDGVFIRPIVGRYLDASSVRGRIAVITMRYPTNPGMSMANWGTTSHSVKMLEDPWPNVPSFSLVGIWVHDCPNGAALSIPHAYLILTLITLAAVPWIRWSKRFTLRTLLIGMAVVSALLGAIIWSVRK
jgi:hypothetical protein